MNLETRQYKVRATAGGDGRTITGLAVPYDTPTEIVPGWTEVIARGAIDLTARPSLFYRHGEPIGVVTEMTDTADGLEITARISDTTQGRDAATLVADGAIRALSIGFFEREWEDKETQDGYTRTQTAIDLREISLVPIPAYDQAQITSVRERKEPTPMNDSTAKPETLTRAQMNETITEATQPLAARLAALEALGTTTAPAPAETRSAGQLIAASVSDPTARAALENYALRAAPSVTTTADAQYSMPNFIGDLTRIISVANPLMQLFSTGTLPPTGNVLEFTQLKENTLTVTEQATEGATLPVGKITTEMIEAARVKTYGGAATISRQAIDRSPANILDLQLRGLALAAGKQLAADFATHFMNAVKTQEAKAITSTKALGSWKWADILSLLLDAHQKYEDNAMQADGLILDRATFQALAGMTDKNDRPIFQVSGNTGSDTVGTVSASGRYADLDGLKVIMSSGLTTTGNRMGIGVVGSFYTADAIRTYASPVVSLQDTNALDLTGAFSVYYYAAFATEIPYGLVPFKVTSL
nr:MAG TPA: head maturation protease [Caudoviricetes sp.]